MTSTSPADRFMFEIPSFEMWDTVTAEILQVPHIIDALMCIPSKSPVCLPLLLWPPGVELGATWKVSFFLSFVSALKSGAPNANMLRTSKTATRTKGNIKLAFEYCITMLHMFSLKHTRWLCSVTE